MSIYVNEGGKTVGKLWFRWEIRVLFGRMVLWLVDSSCQLWCIGGTSSVYSTLIGWTEFATYDNNDCRDVTNTCHTIFRQHWFCDFYLGGRISCVSGWSNKLAYNHDPKINRYEGPKDLQQFFFFENGIEVLGSSSQWVL